MEEQVKTEAYTLDEKLLSLKASLAKKKNKARKLLVEKGVIGKDKVNTYDGYSYTSEAMYKKVFNELVTPAGLELSVSLEEVNRWVTDAKTNKYFTEVRLKFELMDIDTGFSEVSFFNGEGADKSDKALYKAYTGAYKYFVSTTFNLPTGDDAEKDETVDEVEEIKYIKPYQKNIIGGLYQGEAGVERIAKFIQREIKSLDELTEKEAVQIIKAIKEAEKKKKEELTNHDNAG